MVPNFAVPADASSVGWWADGPLFGTPGKVISLVCSQVGGGFAVFNRLGELRPGSGSAEGLQSSRGGHGSAGVVTVAKLRFDGVDLHVIDRLTVRGGRCDQEGVLPLLGRDGEDRLPFPHLGQGKGLTGPLPGRDIECVNVDNP